MFPFQVPAKYHHRFLTTSLATETNCHDHSAPKSYYIHVTLRAGACSQNSPVFYVLFTFLACSLGHFNKDWYIKTRTTCIWSIEGNDSNQSYWYTKNNATVLMRSRHTCTGMQLWLYHQKFKHWKISIGPPNISRTPLKLWGCLWWNIFHYGFVLQNCLMFVWMLAGRITICCYFYVDQCICIKWILHNKEGPNFTPDNTLRSSENCRHLAETKCIFSIEKYEFRISLKFVPKGPIKDIPSLAEIMASTSLWARYHVGGTGACWWSTKLSSGFGLVPSSKIC